MCFVQPVQFRLTLGNTMYEGRSGGFQSRSTEVKLVAVARLPSHVASPESIKNTAASNAAAALLCQGASHRLFNPQTWRVHCRLNFFQRDELFFDESRSSELNG